MCAPGACIEPHQHAAGIALPPAVCTRHIPKKYFPLLDTSSYPSFSHFPTPSFSTQPPTTITLQGVSQPQSCCTTHDNLVSIIAPGSSSTAPQPDLLNDCISELLCQQQCSHVHMAEHHPHFVLMAPCSLTPISTPLHSFFPHHTLQGNFPLPQQSCATLPSCLCVCACLRERCMRLYKVQKGN